MNIQQLHQWLLPADGLLLECDGLTRVISQILQERAIDHRIHVGSLQVEGAGKIPLHWWISLDADNGSALCDWRARMWLCSEQVGPERVAHGVFALHPAQGEGAQQHPVHPAGHHYQARQTLAPDEVAMPRDILALMAGQRSDWFDRFKPGPQKPKPSSTPRGGRGGKP